MQTIQINDLTGLDLLQREKLGLLDNDYKNLLNKLEQIAATQEKQFLQYTERLDTQHRELEQMVVQHSELEQMVVQHSEFQQNVIQDMQGLSAWIDVVSRKNQALSMDVREALAAHPQKKQSCLTHLFWMPKNMRSVCLI
ncbi:MAG: hypothetical protein IPN58_08100 [Anaerolineales bacterium]|nr:hypothetical protein [Anaerolineales bacterium]